MMLIELPEVLNAEQLAFVADRFDSTGFVDGADTAGVRARQVKRNQELNAPDQKMSELNNLVMGALLQHPVYLNAGLPARVAAPIYARYVSGMSYGKHIDDPVMGQGQRYRSDLAVTIFLNDATSYEGGELKIDTAYGLQEIKLAAGDAVMYDAGSVHQVVPVVSGERRVAVTWVQSMIRDSSQRELLYQLYLARENLLKDLPDNEATRQVENSYANLVRMWAEI